MKKIICIFLSASLLLSLCACSVSFSSDSLYTDAELKEAADAAYERGKNYVLEHLDECTAEEQGQVDNDLMKENQRLNDECSQLQAKISELEKENADLKAQGQGKAVPVSSTPSAQSATPVSAPAQPEPAEPAPPTVTYIGNKNTGKFHYPDCSSVSDMKESNKDYLTCSRDEALSRYEPCGRCNP